MRLTEIIEVLRALDTIGEVFKGSDTETLYARSAELDATVVAVSWGDEDPTDIGLDGCLKYDIDRDIIVTMVAPTSDRFEDARLELLDALIGYVPEDSSDLLRYAGGQLLHSAGPVTYSFNFLYNTRT